MITFDNLCNVLDDVNIVDERSPEAYAVCPWCGKPPRDGRGKLARHFHFGRLNGKEFGKCFICGESGGFIAIYRRATGEDVEYTPPPTKPVEPALADAPFWQAHAVALLASYVRHPKRRMLWRDYKPIGQRTLDRYNFGVGILPYVLRQRWQITPCLNRLNEYVSELTDLRPRTGSGGETSIVGNHGLAMLNRGKLPLQHQERLIIPLFEDGALVGLRGRALGHSTPRYKWMSAIGSISPLFGVEHASRGDILVLGENYADAAMVGELRTERNPLTGIALGTARTIRPDEIERLKESQPQLVIVMLDNDLAGQATGATRKQLQEEYQQEHGREAPIPLHGIATANALRAARVPTLLFDWERFNAPAKAGVDWALIHGWG